MDTYEKLANEFKKMGEQFEKIGQEIYDKEFELIMRFNDDVCRRYKKLKKVK